jgi:hypothetical protein
LILPVFALVAPCAPGASPASVLAGLRGRDAGVDRIARIDPAEVSRQDGIQRAISWRDLGANQPSLDTRPAQEHEIAQVELRTSGDVAVNDSVAANDEALPNASDAPTNSETSPTFALPTPASAPSRLLSRRRGHVCFVRVPN